VLLTFASPTIQLSMKELLGHNATLGTSAGFTPFDHPVSTVALSVASVLPACSSRLMAKVQMNTVLGIIQMRDGASMQRSSCGLSLLLLLQQKVQGKQVREVTYVAARFAKHLRLI
jgi:hypothetical protein